jgi:hypothetical protein
MPPPSQAQMPPPSQAQPPPVAYAAPVPMGAAYAAQPQQTYKIPMEQSQPQQVHQVPMEQQQYARQGQAPPMEQAHYAMPVPSPPILHTPQYVTSQQPQSQPQSQPVQGTPHQVHAVQAMPQPAAYPVREPAAQTAASSSSISAYAIPVAHETPQAAPTVPYPAFTAELVNLAEKTLRTALWASNLERVDPSLQVLWDTHCRQILGLANRPIAQWCACGQTLMTGKVYFMPGEYPPEVSMRTLGIPRIPRIRHHTGAFTEYMREHSPPVE